MTLVGIWFWKSMRLADWVWMAALCMTGALGHWLLIHCYEVAEAGAVQTFAFLQLVFASIVGIVVFSQTLRSNVAVGALMITGAGVFALFRERQKTTAS